MGQAKQRGTFEERKEKAIGARKAYNEEFYTSHFKPCVPRQTNRGMSPLALAGIMAAAFHPAPLGMPSRYHEPALKPDKGQKNGSCNRTDCQAPGATWYNHSTRAWYCENCAIDLNFHNADWAIEQYGHDLCTPEV